MNKEKQFDCVKFMRDSRERISKDVMGMSHEEMKKYYKQNAEKFLKSVESQPKSKNLILQFFNIFNSQ